MFYLLLYFGCQSLTGIRSVPKNSIKTSNFFLDITLILEFSRATYFNLTTISRIFYQKIIYYLIFKEKSLLTIFYYNFAQIKVIFVCQKHSESTAFSSDFTEKNLSNERRLHFFLQKYVFFVFPYTNLYTYRVNSDCEFDIFRDSCLFFFSVF